MKKLGIIILFISCNHNNKKNNLIGNQERFIDSLTTVMDSNVFKIKDAGIEDGIIEKYDGYGYFYNKNEPQFLKYYYHGHDKTFLDSNFYYYNKVIIKITIAEKADNQEAINLQVYYFDNSKLLNNKTSIDSNYAKRLMILAKNHLSKLLEMYKLKK